MADQAAEAAVSALSFEEALSELKELVAKLESGEGSLDNAIASYERGALLKRHCETKLREAEARIEKIALSAKGELTTKDFDPE